MQTSFYIDLSVKTPEGHKRFGRFNLGDKREEAYRLFRSLVGSPEVNHHDMLYIEFMEMVNGLPVNLDLLTCNLQELGHNCTLITQEVFRLSSLAHG
jgi:hypothetical protein